MSRRGGNRTTRTTPVTDNTNAQEQGSGTGVEGLATPNMQEMFQQYMLNMMGMTPGAVRAGGAGGVGGDVQPRKADFAKLSKDFLNLGGKTFNGTESIMEVQGWLSTCERIFRDLELEDGMKRRLASRQLTGLAMNLWEAITANTPEEEITWEQFKESFEGKFVPKAQKVMLFKKFVDLTQGNRTLKVH